MDYIIDAPIDYEEVIDDDFEYGNKDFRKFDLSDILKRLNELRRRIENDEFKIEDNQILIQRNKKEIDENGLRIERISKDVMTNSRDIMVNRDDIDTTMVRTRRNLELIIDNLQMIEDNRKDIDDMMKTLINHSSWIKAMSDIGYKYNDIVAGKDLYRKVLEIQKEIHYHKVNMSKSGDYGSLLNQSAMRDGRDLGALLNVNFMPDGLYAMMVDTSFSVDGIDVVSTEESYQICGVTFKRYDYLHVSCKWVFVQKKSGVYSVYDYPNKHDVVIERNLEPLIVKELVYVNIPDDNHRLAHSMLLNYLYRVAAKALTEYTNFGYAASGETAMYMLSDYISKTPVAKMVTIPKLSLKMGIFVNQSFPMNPDSPILRAKDVLPPTWVGLNCYIRKVYVDGVDFTLARGWKSETVMCGKPIFVDGTVAVRNGNQIDYKINRKDDFLEKITVDIDGEESPCTISFYLAMTDLQKVEANCEIYSMPDSKIDHVEWGKDNDNWMTQAKVIYSMNKVGEKPTIFLKGRGEYTVETNLDIMGFNPKAIVMNVNGVAQTFNPVNKNGKLAFVTAEMNVSHGFEIQGLSGVYNIEKDAIFSGLYSIGRYRINLAYDGVNGREKNVRWNYDSFEKFVDNGEKNLVAYDVPTYPGDPVPSRGNLCTAVNSYSGVVGQDESVDLRMYTGSLNQNNKEYYVDKSKYLYNVNASVAYDKINNVAFALDKAGVLDEFRVNDVDGCKLNCRYRFCYNYGYSTISNKVDLNMAVSNIEVPVIVENVLVPPRGLVDPTNFSYELIKLSDDVQRLYSLVSDMYNMITDIDKRVAYLERWIDAFAKQMNQKESTLHQIAQIISIVSGAVGMFLPLVGIAGETLGMVLYGIDAIDQREYVDGVTDFAIAGLMAVYGIRKLLQRRARRFKRGKTTYDKPEMGKHHGTVLHEDPPPDYDSLDFSKGRKVLTVDVSEGHPKLTKLSYDVENKFWRFSVGPDFKSWKVTNENGKIIEMKPDDNFHPDKQKWINDFISEYYSVYRKRSRSILPQPLLTSIVTTIPYGTMSKSKGWLDASSEHWIEYLQKQDEVIEKIENANDVG